MKLEKGRRYVDRLGRRVLIMSIDAMHHWLAHPVFGQYEDGSRAQWCKDGRYDAFTRDDRGEDLVAEAPDEVCASRQDLVTTINNEGGTYTQVPIEQLEGRLQCFIHMLVRDNLSFGKLEDILESCRETDGRTVWYPEPNQAAYALSVARQILGSKG